MKIPTENLTDLTEQTYFHKSPYRESSIEGSVKVGQFGQFGQDAKAISDKSNYHPMPQEVQI
jgi:hypothetical protein